jgi:tetratricopeptide (TPR) repeat protein
MRHAEECLAVATQTGDTQMVCAAHSLLAELELQDGQPENAHSRLQALAPGDEGLDLHSILPTLAEACLTLGYADGAQRYLEEGMRKAATSHSRIGLVDLQRVQVLTLIQQRRWDEAAAVLDRALQAAHSMPYPYAEARLLHTAALLHQQMGDQAQAERSLNEAHAAFQRLGAKRLLGAQPVSDCPGIATQ